jgi:glycosyltransferase involved in cell wall biosynthesis
MACGVPSVCCRKGIAEELIEGGLQICNRSVDSAKAALRRAWRDKENISRLSANYVKENWSWKQHAEKWEEYFRTIKRM